MHASCTNVSSPSSRIASADVGAARSGRLAAESPAIKQGSASANRRAAARLRQRSRRRRVGARLDIEIRPHIQACGPGAGPTGTVGRLLSTARSRSPARTAENDQRRRRSEPRLRVARARDRDLRVRTGWLRQGHDAADAQCGNLKLKRRQIQRDAHGQDPARGRTRGGLFNQGQASLQT